MSKPTWLKEKEATRDMSKKHEGRIAKKLGGKVTSNSGATYHQNDIITPDFEVEAKVTDLNGFRLTSKYFKEVVSKCNFKKIPLLILNFRKDGEEVVVLRLVDFHALTGNDLSGNK